MRTDTNRTLLLTRVRERLAGQSTALTDDVIADAIRTEAGGVIGDVDLLEVMRYLHTELIGAGKLEDLLADPQATDVLVVGHDSVWIDRGRGLERTAIRFDDDDCVRRLAMRLALAAGKRLDDAQPWVDGQLDQLHRTRYSVRLHAILPPISTVTCISLRVLRPATQTFEQLVTSGSVPAEIAPIIERVITLRKAFLVIGGTGTGKTTMLSALLGLADPTERILCVEDASELNPQHPHVVKLLARNANVEGIGAITVRDLVRQSLRMRPNRIIVGEVRGPEVIDLLTALNTGHTGCAGTVHANSSQEVPARLEALAALGGIDRHALHSQLASALDVIIGVSRSASGERGISDLGLPIRESDGLIRMQPVWTRDTGFTADAHNRLRSCGLEQPTWH